MIILALAISLRIWGVAWGLPYLYHPDEWIVVDIAYNFLSGDLNPHNFLYPTLTMYLFSFIYFVWYLVGSILNYFDSMQDFHILYSEKQEHFYLVARLVIVTFSVLTVVVLFKLIKYYYGVIAAIFASLFLSISYLHIQNSQYATVDVPTGFFTILAIYYILRISIKNNKITYILAGIFTGCAVTTKQTGVFLFLPFIIAHYLYSHEKDGIIQRFYSGKIVFYFAALMVSIFVTSPYIFLDFKTFWTFVLQQGDAMQGWLGSEVDRYSWIYYLKLLTVHSKENIGVLLIALCGVWYGIKSKKKETLIIIAFPLIYLLIVGSWKTHFPRYVVPIMPFISGFAGVGIAQLVTGNFIRNKVIKASIIIIVIVLIAANTAKAVIYDITLAHDDTRIIAKKWIEKNIPAGSKIAYEYYTPQLHIRNSGKFYLMSVASIVSYPLIHYTSKDIDYVIISSFYKKRYYRAYKATDTYQAEISRYEALKSKGKLIKTFRGIEHLPVKAGFFISDFIEQETLNNRHYPDLEIYMISNPQYTKSEYEEYQAALRSRPSDPDAHHDLALFYASLGQFSEAIIEYETAIKLKPDNAEAHNNLGNAYAGLGQFDDAIAAYRNALKLRQGFTEVHYNLGLAYAMNSQLDNAIKELRIAIRQKPGYVVAHRTLGTIYFDKGFLQEAVTEYREVIRLDPTRADAYNDLGAVYARLGSLDQAIESFQEALRVNPSNSRARKNLESAQKMKSKQ